MRTRSLQWLPLLVLAALTAGCDLGTKAWAVQQLSAANPGVVAACSRASDAVFFTPFRVGAHVVTLVPHYLDLRYTENCAAAFSLLYGSSPSLRLGAILLGTLAGIAMILHLARGLRREQYLARAGLAVILGGAIGNFWDRVHRGYVVDFVHAHVGARFSWPVFNVADVAVGVGIGLWLLGTLRDRPRATA